MRLHWTGLMLLGLFACDNKGEELIDNDGDGTLAEADCDDSDASIYPGAEELCDGIDNNCDEEIDNNAIDALTVYADSDGDGYGAGAGATLCDAGTGYVENQDDCDDNSATAFPGGAELCDGRDNDCNGIIDDGAGDIQTFYSDLDGDGYGNPDNTKEACAQPSGFVDNADDCDDSDASLSPDTRWYPDNDGDSYGSPINFASGCDQPSGYVTNADDCLDNDSDIYPGAVAEDPKLCMVDSDSDGWGDADPPAGVDAGTDCDDDDVYTYPGAVAEDPKLCMTDNDGDGWGDASPADGVDAGTDCNDDDAGTYPGAVAEDPKLCMTDSDGDGWGDASPRAGIDAGTDCNDANAAVYPGAAEVCDYEDNDCNGQRDDNASDATTYYLDSDGDTYGVSTSTITACTQPINGSSADGDCDDTDNAIYPGAPEDCTDGIDNNCNSLTDEVCTLDLDDADVTFENSALGTYDYYGWNMQAGDINGDGTDDAILSAYYADSTTTSVGGTYIHHGPMTAGDTLDSSTDADATIFGSSTHRYTGRRLAVGDLDGDGYDDVAINSYYYSSYAGAVLIYYGPVSGTLDPLAADATVAGVNSYDYMGYYNFDIVDLDEDSTGAAELLIGAYAYDYTASGGSQSSGGYSGVFKSPSGSLTIGDGDIEVYGASSSDYTGYASTAGDLDGDGENELLVGAPYYEDAVFVFQGPVSSGTMTLADADFSIDHRTNYDYCGTEMVVGDFDGDGTDDFVTSCYYDDIANTYEGTSNYSMGAIYVFYGPISSNKTNNTDADAIIYETTSYSYMGGAYYGDLDAADMDGDGTDELVISHSYDDLGASNAGGVYVLGGALSGAGTLSDFDFSAAIVGTTSNQYLGRQVATGDFDEDGELDILTGSYSANSYYGGNYMFFGSNL